ncbi:MAG: sensor histidine kinase, partial [Acidiferrobacteraceae bacterium]
MNREPKDNERIIVLAPTGRDAPMAVSVLAEAGLRCHIAPDLPAVCSLMESAGALLLAQEALDATRLQMFTAALGAQPSWSDLPLVVMTSGSKTDGQQVFRLFSPHADVTLIERPVHMLTLISIMKGALRSRRRQYLVRDLFEQQTRAMRQRDTFLSIASHELKTPLTALRIQVQAYRLGLRSQRPESGAPPDMVRFLDRTNRQIDRLVHLVEDMLDVSRVDAGRLTLVREWVDLNLLVTDVIERFKPQLETAGCPPSCSLGREACGYWDPFRVEQIITNLLTNALKYASGAPIEVVTARSGEHVWLRVIDHGPGIAPQDQERVFDRFARVAAGG